MTDLTALTDDELATTLLLLGERAQEVSDATACVRAEQQRRATPPVATVDGLGEYGSSALASAVDGAPAKVKEIAEAEAEAARLAAEAEAAAAVEVAADG